MSPLSERPLVLLVEDDRDGRILFARWLLTQKGLITFALGDRSGALAQLKRGRRIHRAFKDRRWLRTNLHNVGLVLMRPRPALAAKAFRQAIALAKAAGDKEAAIEDAEWLVEAQSRVNQEMVS